MNQTETKAYNWFISQGVPENVIFFQASKTPDFLFTDRDVKYEVKRLYGKKILIGVNQLDKLKAQDNIVILVFSDDSDEPIERIPVSEIDEKTERYGNILIHFVPSPSGSLVEFKAPKNLIDEVDDKIERDGKHSHRTDLILFLLRKYLGGEIE